MFYLQYLLIVRIEYSQLLITIISIPLKTYSTVATRFDIAKATLQDCHQGTHVPRDEKGPCKLSIAQEDAVLASINAYAD